MDKEILQQNSENILIQTLLERGYNERAQIRRWNIYSLLLSWLVLAIVIILSVLDVNQYIIELIAILGLSSFWLMAHRQGKKLERQFFKKDTEVYQNGISEKAEHNSSEISQAAEQTPLSNREMEVLTLIVQGNSNKEIAKIMNITPHTAKYHITHILNKLNVADRTSAAVIAFS